LSYHSCLSLLVEELLNEIKEVACLLMSGNVESHARRFLYAHGSDCTNNFVD